MANALPTRDHEEVALFPFNDEAIADMRSPTSLDRKHGCVRRAIGCRRESFWQQLHESADRRHGVTAGDRIGVAHLQPVAGIPRFCAPQPLQGVTCPGVGIVEDRRAAAAWLVVDGKKIGAVASIAVANRAVDRLFVLIEMFRKRGVEKLHDGNIEPVEPEDRLVALIAVIVLGPWRRDDEVALVHDRALAVDGRIGAGALQHETKRALRVPVRGRGLAGQH